MFDSKQGICMERNEFLNSMENIFSMCLLLNFDQENCWESARGVAGQCYICMYIFYLQSEKLDIQCGEIQGEGLKSKGCRCFPALPGTSIPSGGAWEFIFLLFEEKKVTWPLPDYFFCPENNVYQSKHTKIRNLCGKVHGEKGLSNAP